MSLASIQPILSVVHHPNADLLDVVTVLRYQCIVKRDQWQVGQLCVFIEPDTVLPDVPWAAFYRAKSNRVKAIRLRQVWSMGIVESAAATGYTGPMGVGTNVAATLGITHYEPPMPQDLAASGPYGFGIPKTDQERWQSLVDIPFGAVVDVTLKVDGQSWSALCKLPDPAADTPLTLAVGGRSFLYKPESTNHYTRNEANLGVLAKLEVFCRERNVSLCLRGEQYGNGIQAGAHNPHSKQPLNLAFFSTWLIDERQYAHKGHPLYIHTIAGQLGLPIVPVLERDVILTPELITRYDEQLEQVGGQSFEGVVINHVGGSFKVINKHFDSRK